jgi:hypothetical protein
MPLSLSLSLSRSDCATASTTSACIADSENFHHHHYGECMTHSGPGFCQHIGLSDADAALEFALGPTAGLIWACGLLASGQSSTMTTTYAGQFVNEGFGEVCSLSLSSSLSNSPFLQFHIPLYQRISLCRLVALVPAVIAATLEATHPSSMDDATQVGNIIGSICVPFTIIPMLKFCNSTRLMGVRPSRPPHSSPSVLRSTRSAGCSRLSSRCLPRFSSSSTAASSSSTSSRSRTPSPLPLCSPYHSLLPLPHRHVPVLASTLLGLLTAMLYIFLNYLLIHEEVDLLLLWLFKRAEAFCLCPWTILQLGAEGPESLLDSSASRSSHNLLSSPPNSPGGESVEKGEHSWVELSRA